MAWLFALFLFFLPGFLVSRIVLPSKEKIPFNLFISFSLFFSFAIIPTVFFLISLIKPLALNFSTSFLILATTNLILYSLSAKKIPVKISFLSKKENCFLILVILISLLLLLAPYFRPHLGPFWSTYHFGVGRDIEKHLGLINGLKIYGLPPKNPFIPGQPLNYYYFYHLDTAVLSILSGNTISSEFSHLLLSAFILIASSLLLSALVHHLICLTLFLGYGFDFFPMIAILLKIRPYQLGLNHLDEWTAPFAPQLKVNPLSVWFAWAPQHTLALFLFFLFTGIFFDSIRIEKKLKQPCLAILLFAILGSSAYVFLGAVTTISLFWLYQYLIRHRSQSLTTSHQFVFLAFPLCLALILPMILRIRVPTITLYPFWQFPRDHLFSFKFPHFPPPHNIILLGFFLIERFLVYFFDLGLLFVLSIYFWKKVPKNNSTIFAKIMLIASTLISVLLKSVPFNNDLCYRISGLSWLACAFLVNSQEEKLWLKLKNRRWALLILALIVFSPTIVEQLVFPYQKTSPEFWELKNYISQNIPQDAILQSPLEFSPATVYLFERKMIYYPTGLIFYPDKEEAGKMKEETDFLFSGTPEESRKIAVKYKIEYLLTENQNLPFTKSLLFKKVFGNTGYSLYRFEDIPPSKQTL